ncbi:MAG: putative manganese-dependent inorganic diphosphatase [Coriobacteriales bacterium]
MNNEIIVMGHIDPDNDSIASAVAYAYLKNVIDPDNTYVPARLGPMPKETQWVFDEYKVPTPIALPHIYKRVCDVMTADPMSIPCDMTMLEAGRIFNDMGVRALVVNDLDGKYMGMLTLARLAELYVAESEITGFTHSSVKVGNLLKAFDGKIVVGDPESELYGKLLIGANEPTTAAAAVEPGDTIITGDRKRTQPLVLRAGAKCLILSCGAKPSDELIELAKEQGAALLCSEYDTYTTARLASLAQTVDIYVDTDAATFSPQELLSDATDDILSSRHRESVVLDENGYAIGIITRSDLARPTKRDVILVDHNSMAESAPGIEEAHVCEIVDHHRVGDVQTSSPIQFLGFPWGSTSTIVARQFRVSLVDVPRPIAAILLSAIMTDTVLLKSPQTTEEDVKQARHLADILCVDPVEFGKDVFRSRGVEAEIPIDDVIGRDVKDYRFGDGHFLIAQHDTVDMDALLARSDEIQEGMDRLIAERGYDTVLLMATDVVREGSQLFCAGDCTVIEHAFNVSFDEGSVWIPGIFSRKKQVVPRIIENGFV